MVFFCSPCFASLLSLQFTFFVRFYLTPTQFASTSSYQITTNLLQLPRPLALRSLRSEERPHRLRACWSVHHFSKTLLPSGRLLPRAVNISSQVYACPGAWSYAAGWARDWIMRARPGIKLQTSMWCIRRGRLLAAWALPPLRCSSQKLAKKGESVQKVTAPRPALKRAGLERACSGQPSIFFPLLIPQPCCGDKGEQSLQSPQIGARAKESCGNLFTWKTWRYSTSWLATSSAHSTHWYAAASIVWKIVSYILHC